MSNGQSKLGVITEQGDFGLGFSEVSEQDAKKINEKKEDKEK